MGKGKLFWSTKTEKIVKVHPSFAENKAWLQSHGYIPYKEPSIPTTTNMPTKKAEPQPTVKSTENTKTTDNG